MIRRPPRSTLFPTRRSSDLLRVPAPRLVPEVHAALQQLLHTHNCHFFNLPKVKPPPGALIEAPRSRAPPEGGMRNTFAAPRRMCVIDNTKDSISKSSDFEDSFRPRPAPRRPTPLDPADAALTPLRGLGTAGSGSCPTACCWAARPWRRARAVSPRPPIRASSS